MKTSVIILILILSFNLVQGQSNSSDLKLIMDKEESSILHEKSKLGSYNPISIVFRQIHFGSKYSNSFPEFSKASIRQFGIVKGSVMAIDRILRTGRLSYIAVPKVRINNNGRIIDLPYHYSN